MLKLQESCPSFCMVLVDYQWHGKCVLHDMFVHQLATLCHIACHIVHQLATVFTCWALGYMRTEAQSLQKLLYYINVVSELYISTSLTTDSDSCSR